VKTSLFRISEADMVDVFQQELGEGSQLMDVQEAPPAATSPVITLNDRRPAHSASKRSLRRKLDRFRAHIGLPGATDRSPSAAEVRIGLSESEQEKAIDSMIVARAFKPSRTRRRWGNWQPREVMLGIMGGALAIGLLLLLIYLTQAMQ